MMDREFLQHLKELLLFVIGFLILGFYIYWGKTVPVWEPDIEFWSANDPIVIYSLIPSIIVKFVSDLAAIPLIRSFVLVSCIAAGITIIIYLQMVFHITQSLFFTLLCGFLMAFSRAFLIISLSGENDLIYGAYFLLVFYYFTTLLSHPQENAPSYKKLFRLGIVIAPFPFFHLQLILFWAIFPPVFIFLSQRESFKTFFWKRVLISHTVLYLGLFICALSLFVLSNMYLRNGLISIPILMEFFLLFLPPLQAYFENPVYFYFSSERTLLDQFNLFLNGLSLSFYYDQFLLFYYESLFEIIPFFIFSLGIIFSPVIRFKSIENHVYRNILKSIFFSAGIFSLYVFFYEPQSPERWSSLLLLIFIAIPFTFNHEKHLNYEFNPNLGLKRTGWGLVSAFMGIVFSWLYGTKILIIDEDIARMIHISVVSIGFILILVILLLPFQRSAFVNRSFIFFIIMIFLIMFFCGVYIQFIILFINSCSIKHTLWCL